MRPIAANAALRPFQISARSARVLGDPDVRGLVVPTDPLHPFELRLHLHPDAVELNHQRGGCVERVAGAGRLLTRFDRQRVEHLDGGRDDAGRDDVADRVARLLGVGEVGDQRADRLGLAQQPHGDLGDDADGAFRADDQGAQVRPDLVQRVAAQGDHAAVGAHHREPEDMVCGEAILQAVRAARVLRHVAPDSADDLARRVGSVVQLVGGRRGGDAEVGHARLDDRALVLRVDGEDLPHPGQPDDDPVGDGQRTAGQAGTRTAGDKRNPFPGADPHHRRDLLGARRQHNQRRNHPEAGQPVAFIGAKLGRFRDDAAFADQPADLSADLLGDPPGGLLGDQVEIDRCHSHRPLNPSVIGSRSLLVDRAADVGARPRLDAPTFRCRSGSDPPSTASGCNATADPVSAPSAGAIPSLPCGDNSLQSLPFHDQADGGADVGYPVALEGALKLKELAYMHAEGFAAGELKHGPIALIGDGLPVIVVMPSPKNSRTLHSKLLSNIREIQARGAITIVIAEEGDDTVRPYADHLFEIPSVSTLLQPLLSTIPLQVFAAGVAQARGYDVDKPRNLAKSVTVE